MDAETEEIADGKARQEVQEAAKDGGGPSPTIEEAVAVVKKGVHQFDGPQLALLSRGSKHADQMVRARCPAAGTARASGWP